jgi:polyferredoxin
MLKIDRPKGLIRYASYNSIQKGVRKLISARVVSYAVILVGLLSMLGFTLLTRADVETTVLKVPGTLYQKGENGVITNLYNVEFVNKTFSELSLELRVIEPKFATLRKPDGKQVTVAAESMLKTVFFVGMPADNIQSAKTVVTLGVFNNNKEVERVTIKFIGPIKSTL